MAGPALLIRLRSFGDSVKWSRRDVRRANGATRMRSPGRRSGAVIRTDQRSHDRRLDARPVVHDLVISESKDAVAEPTQAGVAARIPLPLVELAAVDLDDQPIAEHEVDPIDPQLNLLSNRDAERSRPQQEQRLRSAAREIRGGRKEDARAVGDPSEEFHPSADVEHTLAKRRLQHDEGDLARLAADDIEHHLERARHETIAVHRMKRPLTRPVDDGIRILKPFDARARPPELARPGRHAHMDDTGVFRHPEPPETRGGQTARPASDSCRRQKRLGYSG